METNIAQKNKADDGFEANYVESLRLSSKFDLY